jgi:hypothetical protein
MKTIIINRALAALYILMTTAILILPVFFQADYSITISEISKADSHQQLYLLILNSILAGLAIVSVIAGWDYYRDFGFQRIILVFSGISMALAVVFNPALKPSLQNDTTLAAWHSYFLSTAVLSFIILSVSTAFILEKKRERVMTLAAAATILILVFFSQDSGKTAGLWQKAILITEYGWLVCIFNIKEP